VTLPWKLHQKAVVARIDRLRDARHRQAKGPSGSFRADARHADQRFEKLPFDRIAEAEERKTRAIAVDRQVGIDLERDPLAERPRQFLVDAGREHDLVSEAAHVEEHAALASFGDRAANASEH
jgi:hypothetical protein